MYELFTMLLNMSFTAGILVFVIIVLRLCLKKAPRKYICILWALIALRLICPVGIPSSLSLLNLMNMGINASGQINYFQYNGTTEKPSLIFDVPSLTEDHMSTDSMTVGKRTSDVYLPAAMYIWLFGVVIMLAYAVISYIQLKKQVSASVHRGGRIFVCDDIHSPFILGIISPRIYLPSGLNEKTKKNVIVHEFAHLERHDHWWKPFGYILLSGYWFNPVLWVAYILFCQDIEVACDEKVIADMDKDSIAGYSESLLACAVHRRMITVCPIAFGETDVKGRVKRVLTYKKPTFWSICVAIVTCIIAAVCLLTNPKGEEDTIEIPNGYPSVVAVYEPNTDSKPISEDEFIIFEKYYEMSDGTWSTDTCSYRFRLEITGRAGSAEKDITYLYLSNIEEISFYQAMMASGVSSNMADYFDEEDAKFIGCK